MVEHQTLNLGVLGSNPSFRRLIKYAGVMELVDMLGLEPSAFGVQVRVLFPVKNS